MRVTLELKEQIYDELNEHLNESCVDSDCVVPEVEEAFSHKLLDHLSNVILEVIEDYE